MLKINQNNVNNKPHILINEHSEHGHSSIDVHNKVEFLFATYEAVHFCSTFLRCACKLSADLQALLVDLIRGSRYHHRIYPQNFCC